MNECNICGGTGFVIVERGGISAAKRCNCREPAETEQAGRAVTPEMATAATEALCDVLEFAPSTKLGRMLIGNAPIAMCPHEDSVWWLVERACTLHTKWGTCGIPGLRQILCSRYLPKDGRTISATAAYPEGVPPERSLQQQVLFPALPPSRVASVDAEMDQALQPPIPPRLRFFYDFWERGGQTAEEEGCAKFAGYLLARVEAIEDILIQKEVASKPELRDAIDRAQTQIVPCFRGEYQDEKDLELVLRDILNRLQSRQRDRLYGG